MLTRKIAKGRKLTAQVLNGAITHIKMKKIIFSIALMLFVSIAFANNSIVEKQKTTTIENTADKFVARFNLGNVSNLSDSEISALAENLIQGIKNDNSIDECTVSLTAEVNVGFGSVSATVSYTASDCETAAKKAMAALVRAVKLIKAATI
jgi:hypothetical protein